MQKRTLCLGLCIDIWTRCFMVHEIIRAESEEIPAERACSGRESKEC